MLGNWTSVQCVDCVVNTCIFLLQCEYNWMIQHILEILNAGGFWKRDMLWIENMSPKIDKMVEKSAVNLARNCCAFLDVIKCKPATQISQCAEDQQFNLGCLFVIFLES